MHAWRSAAWVGVAATALLIGLITLTPQAPSSPHGAVSQAILDALHWVGVPESFGPVEWEFTANIIMFMPLGFFLALTLIGRFPAPTHTPHVRDGSAGGVRGRDVRPWVYLGVFPAATGFIETTQLLFLPSRYATWSDIIANSVGGWVGYAVGLLVLAAVSRRFSQ